MPDQCVARDDGHVGSFLKNFAALRENPLAPARPGSYTKPTQNEAPLKTSRRVADLRWGHSSVGRALEWHSRGQGFDSPWLHQFSLQKLRISAVFAFLRLISPTDFPTIRDRSAVIPATSATSSAMTLSGSSTGIRHARRVGRSRAAVNASAENSTKDAGGRLRRILPGRTDPAPVSGATGGRSAKSNTPQRECLRFRRPREVRKERRRKASTTGSPRPSTGITRPVTVRARSACRTGVRRNDDDRNRRRCRS